MGVKEVLKKITYGKRYSSETYIEYLRKIGVVIGEDCTIYVPTKTLIDVQYPWMITIGNHVRITEGVKILTHDYSWSVLKIFQKSRGGVLGASGYVNIGNNVFIGMNAIITRNVQIGDNVIIGAGSVVTKDCEENSVYAGNPARKIMTINDYYNKRIQAQAEEAKILALKYFGRYGKRPEKNIFHEYFMLFSKRDDILKDSLYLEKAKLCENFQESIVYIEQNPPLFENFEEFLRYCFDEK